MVSAGERILDDLDPAPEHGWLAPWRRSSHWRRARPSCPDWDQARQLGRDLGITDLEMLGLATEGLALVTEGKL